MPAVERPPVTLSCLLVWRPFSRKNAPAPFQPQVAVADPLLPQVLLVGHQPSLAFHCFYKMYEEFHPESFRVCFGGVSEVKCDIQSQIAAVTSSVGFVCPCEALRPPHLPL